MNLTKKIADQICKYYEDLEMNAGKISPEMSSDLQEELVYERIMQGIAHREKAKYRFRKIFAAACAAVVMFALLITGYHQLSPSKPIENQVTMRTAVALKGRVIQLTLMDGTVIWLNSGTKLTYPTSFSNHTREVTLDGEAYFQVTHNPKKPFLIHTSRLTTRVLGTSFNIKAYQEDREIQVAVLTGKVGVTHLASEGQRSETKLLMPNERITYNKENQHMSVEKMTRTENLISWRTGDLQYDEEPLGTIVADLQRKYSIKIGISPALEKRRVTVDLNNESIKKVMVILSEVTGAKIIETKEGFILRKNTQPE
ncbi:FecR family protein [Pedobacter metabolipauper]|uniref:FecR family protein n=1 Tax=Pedobacter metabolipauper TaxID=425513 RepID=A0A4R6SW77_9SPHI|nr:FecR domain-containing protein [Pedobacter metabolipauper]TDQ09661.1 FecR family protein [Pedobacter metabolipauper]